MNFSLGQTKLTIIPGCPYLAPDVRRAGFHCIFDKLRAVFRNVMKHCLKYLLYNEDEFFNNDTSMGDGTG